MNTRKIFLFFLLALIFTACANDNAEDKYGGGPNVIPAGEIARFPLNGDLSNEIEGSNIQLFFNGKGSPEFVSGGVGGSQALKLNGEDNYLMIPAGVYDTLSIVFWVKMDNEFFRTKNAKPVWIDYGMGAVKVTVDGITGSTQMRVTWNQSDYQIFPSGQYEDVCTWYRNAFFYTEIVKSKITCRIRTRYSVETENDFTISVDKSQSPVDIKSDVLYIGRPSGTGPFSGEYLQGTIDDIHLFNRGLTDVEVNAFALKN